VLGGQPEQPPPAGGDELALRRRRHERRDLRDRAGVVGDDEHPPAVEQGPVGREQTGEAGRHPLGADTERGEDGDERGLLGECLPRVVASQVEEHLAVGEPVGHLVRPPDHERGLADPGRAGHDQHLRLVPGARRGVGERAQLVGAAAEVTDAGRQLRGRVLPAPRPALLRLGRCGFLVVEVLGVAAAQDRGVQCAQVVARVAAQLVGEPGAQRLVGVQCVGAAVGPVQGGHVLAGEPLPQRVRRDGRRQLGDQLGVPAQLQLGVEAGLEQADVQLREPGPVGVRAGCGHPVERLAAPPRECAAQQFCCLFRRGGRRRLKGEPLAFVDVHLDLRGIEEISRVPGDQYVADFPAQGRDQALHAGARRGRQSIAPQLIDDPIGRERNSPGEREERQQVALQRGQCDLRAGDANLDRTE
jgi:hypothetical protein